jgi:HPt (histidine-containing phosphotransfer) domain-containing protein
MTFGQKDLQAEILALFHRQAEMLLPRMQHACPEDAAALAHTMAGSARGIGAWKLAAAAEGVELAVKRRAPAEFRSALRRLAAAVSEAQSCIGSLLVGK